jgi:hypothetical protein
LVTRQEIAESLGQALDEDEDDETADMDVEEEGAAPTETGTGAVFVAQSGQLFYIGATTGAVEAALDDLRPDAPQGEIKLIHTFLATNPSGTEATLRRKYANKRQKDNWFGLSKKDIAWLKARRDQ